MAAVLEAPRNSLRKIRATAPTAGGSLHHGNRYTVTTARTIVLAADVPQAWHGDKPTMPPQYALDAAADRKMAAGYTKRNKVCPGCGIMTPATGRCGQCWD